MTDITYDIYLTIKPSADIYKINLNIYLKKKNRELKFNLNKIIICIIVYIHCIGYNESVSIKCVRQYTIFIFLLNKNVVITTNLILLYTVQIQLKCIIISKFNESIFVNRFYIYKY